MNPNMDLFYVVISLIFVCELIVAIVLWVVDSRMDYKKKSAVVRKMESGKGMRVESDDLYLKVRDGKIEICDELPEPAPAPEPAAAAADESAPVVPIRDTLDDKLGGDAEKIEALETLLDKYGDNISENSVIIEVKPRENLTFADKYAALEEARKNLYDEFMSYALAKPGCKKIEASKAVTVKYRTDKVCRAVIKRGVPVLNFMLGNTELNRYVREAGVKGIKISPVVVRLESDDDLKLAKQTADITVGNLEQEREYRKQRAREQRRLKYSRAKEAAAAQDAVQG